MLTSAIHQHESAIGIYPFPPSSASLRLPTPLGYHRAPDLSSLHRTVNFRWLSDFPYRNVHVSKRSLLFSYSRCRHSPGSGTVCRLWSARRMHVEPLPCSDASGGRVSHHEGVTLDTRYLKGTGGTEDQRKRERRGSSQGGGSVSGRAPREARLRSVFSHTGAMGTP